MGPVGRQCLQVGRPRRARLRARHRLAACRSAKAATSDGRLVSGPVVGGGRVYTIDTHRRWCARSTRAMAAQVWSARFGEPDSGNKDALRRRRRVRQRPGLRHQRPRLCRRARRRDRRRRRGRSSPAARCAARRRSPATRVYVITQDNQIFLAQDRRRRDQLVERRGARDRRRVRLGLAGRRARHGRRRLLVGRAQRLSLREWPPGVAGRACRAPPCRPASPPCPTSTPTR